MRRSGTAFLTCHGVAGDSNTWESSATASKTSNTYSFEVRDF